MLIAKGCALMTLRSSRIQKIWFAADEARTKRILSLEEREAGRAQLVVKDFEGGDDSRQNATEYGGRGDTRVECRWGGQDACGEFSCASPAAGAGGKKRLLWRTSLCAFSGRTEEVSAFAARIIS